MLLTHGALKEKSSELAAAMAAARSAKNLETRRRNEVAADEREADRHRRRRKRKEDRELEQLLHRKVRVRVPFDERPRVGTKTARKLFQRAAGVLRGTSGLSDARGPDGLYSLHFGFVARGFASKTGRQWRAGEAERAARYIVREESLEGGELGWWSNIADDRNELVAFFRASEAIERHDRKNANVYCTEIIALPAELSARQRRRAVKRICRFFKKRGLPYVVAIHVPDTAGDQRNYHCHIIYSLRPSERHGPYDWSFGLSKEGDINTRDGIAARRRTVVRDINATLHAAGIAKRYTHLSNKSRRMAAAQAKIGQNGTWIARRLVAMEAREALLRKVRSLAGEVRSALVEADTALSRLEATAEQRRDALAQRSAIRDDLQERVSTGGGRIMALRQAVEHRLLKQRSALTAGVADTQVEIQLQSLRVKAMLGVNRDQIEEATYAVDRRISRAERRAILQGRIEVLQAVRSGADTTRLARLTDVVRVRLGQRLSTLGDVPIECRGRLDRAKTDVARVMGDRRQAIVISLIESGRRLERAGKRSRLLEKRQLVSSVEAEAEIHGAMLLSIQRRVAMIRLRAMRAVVEPISKATGPFSRRLTSCRAVAIDRLTTCREALATSIDAVDQALASAKASGRRLLAGGIGNGPHDISVASPPYYKQPPERGTEVKANISTTMTQLRGMRARIAWIRKDEGAVFDRLAACGAAATHRLTSRRTSLAKTLDATDRTLASVKANGRRLLAGGIGKGPSDISAAPQVSGAATISRSPVSQSVAVVETGAAAGNTSTEPDTFAAVSEPAAVHRNDDQEILRGHVRMRRPDPAIEMMPPPPSGHAPPGPNVRLQHAAELELIREEVRRREKRVRQKLRERTLRRLMRFDIPIVLEPSGRYAVAKGVLADDEMRVLMDPMMARETQASLARVAAHQHQRSVGAAPNGPVIGQSRSSSAGADLQRLQLQKKYLAGRSGKGAGQ